MGLTANFIRWILYKNKDISSIHPMRVIIFSIYGIGNSILSIPLVKLIKENFPDCHVTLVYTNKIALQIVPKYLIDSSIFFENDNKWAFLKLMLKTEADIVYYLYPFKNQDLIELSSLIKSKYRVGYNNIPYKKLTHMFPFDESKSEWLLNIELFKNLFRYTANISLDEPIITPDEKLTKDLFPMDNDKHTVIGIHPGAGAFEKQWPVHNFIKLINKVTTISDLKILLVGGPEEKLKGDQIEQENPFVINLIGKLSIIQTAAIIKNCAVFISNDSGLMHLAGAVGTPQIAIFGPTPIPKNRPWGNQEHKILLQSDCPPCYKDGHFNCTRKVLCRCLSDITHEQVFDSLIKLLTKLHYLIDNV